MGDEAAMAVRRVCVAAGVEVALLLGGVMGGEETPGETSVIGIRGGGAGMS